MIEIPWSACEHFYRVLSWRTMLISHHCKFSQWLQNWCASTLNGVWGMLHGQCRCVLCSTVCACTSANTSSESTTGRGHTSWNGSIIRQDQHICDDWWLCHSSSSIEYHQSWHELLYESFEPCFSTSCSSFCTKIYPQELQNTGYSRKPPYSQVPGLYSRAAENCCLYWHYDVWSIGKSATHFHTFGLVYCWHTGVCNVGWHWWKDIIGHYGLL